MDSNFNVTLRCEKKKMLNYPNQKKTLAFLPAILAVIVLFASSLACRTAIPETSSPAAVTVIVQEPVPSTPVVIKVPEPVLDEQSLLIQLYERVNPAVVNITTFISQGNQLVGYSEGSGFVIDANGSIVTNAHVVHGADFIEITFSDATTRPAELLGEDFNSDLAVIQVKDFPANIEPLNIGDDEAIQVGQTVVAIGNPFGLEGTMTRGIVSAVGRTIPALNTFGIPRAIQTDAPINPGNSGGPLLNLSGDVIGVNAQIRTDSGERANSGVGFAIPASILKRVVPALIAEGKYTWSWLGVTGSDLDWVTAKAMNLPVDRGAYLSSIVENGPSSKAGLQGSRGPITFEGRRIEVGGDIIIAINRTPVYSFDDLLVYIALEAKPGDIITLTVLRDGREQEIDVTLEPRPAELIAPLFPGILPEEP
jgi:S1-C subfamily serine protease